MNTTESRRRSVDRTNASTVSGAPAAHEPWYKYGVAALVAEIAIAVLVSAYSLYMAFNGLGGFPGKH